MKRKQLNEYTKLYNHIKVDKNLDCAERLIYNLIYNFTIENKSCFASNSYIAENVGVDIRKVKRTIKKLVDLKYIILVKYHDNKTKRNIILYNSKLINRDKKGDFESAKFYLVYAN